MTATNTNGVRIKFYALGIIYLILAGTEFAAGFRQDSPALLTDSYFNLFTCCIWFLYGTRYESDANKKYTYGKARIDPFGKMFVATCTAALYFSTFMEGIQIMFQQERIPDQEYIIELLTFGGVGIGLNIISCIILGASMECTYEMEPMQKYWVVRFSSELLKLINNLSGSILILSIGLVNFWRMGAFPFYKCVLDGLAAMLLVALQTPALWTMTKENAKILLQCTPGKRDTDEMKQQLLNEYHEIVDVHELHVWELQADDVIVTAHLVLVPSLMSDKSKVALLGKQVKEFFQKLGGRRVTLQYEFASSMASSALYSTCLSTRPDNDADCSQQKCCITQPDSADPADPDDLEGHGHSHKGGSHGHSHSGHGHSHGHTHNQQLSLGA